MEEEIIYDTCSLKRTKRLANEFIKTTTLEDDKQLRVFWSFIKQQLLSAQLAIDDTKESKFTAYTEKEISAKFHTAEQNRLRIEEMLSVLTEKISKTKLIENVIGVDEVTQQDVMMLEEALEMVKMVNELNRKALDELKKIQSVRMLGENIKRNSCSLIPKERRMDMV